MISNRDRNGTRDVPPILALFALGAVVGGLFYLESPTTFSLLERRLERYAFTHSELLTAALISFGINALCVLSIGSRLFGKHRQGAKLDELTGRDVAKNRAPWMPSIVATALGLIAFGLMHAIDFPAQNLVPPVFASSEFQNYLLIAMQANFAIATFVILQRIAGFGVWRKLGRAINRKLPKFPAEENTIVLGSIDEEDLKLKPRWMVLNKVALYGNILITGSIGVGKTLGMILSYLDQILANFSPRPAMLNIDPKGTFIPRALKILKERGLMEHVLHLRIGGNVTINPLYHERPLKNSRFLETAQMVKAASANALRGGSSKDSDFWDISAFNLIKNCLVYCYAVYGYTTLEDLYKTMIRANNENYKPALAKCIDSGEFDEEEKFNIRCAIDYFESEYKQLDTKVRTSILATATSFLNQFQEYQANRLFCPKEEDLTIRSMDDVIDQGKILLFDIRNPVLARSMGTFVKLLYEQSVLNRLADETRPQDRSVVMIADECQDVITTGTAAMIGDVTYLAKAREAKSITIMGTQSQTSIENALGSEKAAAELIQNFRTRLAAHSGDSRTIRSFQELIGREERTRTSHSVSENSQHPNRNLILGGYESSNSNISESISTTEYKEDTITGKEFSRLKSFECFGLIYDGIETHFKKLYLRPYFLKEKNISYVDFLKSLKKYTAVIAAVFLSAGTSYAFPNVCTVVKSADFRSCLDFSVGSCMCGWPIPRPCARFTYYVPQTFVEVFPNPKSSYFGDLPGAATQLASLGKMPVPFGAEADDDTQSFHSHVLGVPFAYIPFSMLPCGGSRFAQPCFEGMSEHLGAHWSTGSGDRLQPNMLAWSLSPKACMIKGAATSVTGGSEPSFSSTFPSCSRPMGWLSNFPPSNHSACNGWGVFYPRSGIYNGSSQTTGALMIASRMKSLGAEVFQATPSSYDETWQMIAPQSSSCFREGQNVGILDAVKNVREIGRLASGKLTGHLFVVWSKVSCCRDLVEVPAAYMAIEAMSVSCQGLGAL